MCLPLAQHKNSCSYSAQQVSMHWEMLAYNVVTLQSCTNMLTRLAWYSLEVTVVGAAHYC